MFLFRLTSSALLTSTLIIALPFSAPFAMTLLAAIVRRPRDWVRKLLAALVGVQAALELASEAYVVAKVGRHAYCEAYANPKPRARLALFWLGGVLTIAATLMVGNARHETDGGAR